MILTSLDELEARLAAPNAAAAMSRFAQYCLDSSIPWGIPRGALVQRFGLATWRAFSECVFLPRSELFGLPITELRAEICPRIDEIPVTSFAAAHAVGDDVVVNHERARMAIAAFAGTGGVAGRAANAIQHSWSFGIYGVTVISFPRERNLATPNSLYERNPELWTQTTIRLETAVAWPDADTALACVAEPTCRRLEVPRGTGVSLGTGALEANRLHPTMVGALVPSDSLLAWYALDGARGLSNRVATISWRGAPVLSLTRRRHARGPGGASLEVGRTSLLLHGEESGLDDLANDLARFYALPLSKTTVDAD